MVWLFWVFCSSGLIATTEPAKTIDSQCKSLNVSLTQKIDNEGFHRELNWLMERSPKSLQCHVALKFDVGPEMYLNPDEIADLNRLGLSDVVIDGWVDIEAPAHLADEHTAYIFVPSHRHKISLHIPFHLRYQRAQISGGYGKVPVSKPSVLAICPKRCSKSQVEGPCPTKRNVMCVWNNVSYQALFEEMELLLPVGDLDDYPLVSVVTLLLGCAGCIYTLSVLSTTPL